MSVRLSLPVGPIELGTPPTPPFFDLQFRLVKSTLQYVYVEWTKHPNATKYNLWLDGKQVSTAGPGATTTRFKMPDRTKIHSPGIGALQGVQVLAGAALWVKPIAGGWQRVKSDGTPWA